MINSVSPRDAFISIFSFISGGACIPKCFINLIYFTLLPSDDFMSFLGNNILQHNYPVIFHNLEMWAKLFSPWHFNCGIVLFVYSLALLLFSGFKAALLV